MKESQWGLEFSHVLKGLLIENRMSQKELAGKAGLSQATITGYLNRHKKPSIKALINLSYALDCPLNDLVDYGEPIE